jgi:hypothetical protein
MNKDTIYLIEDDDRVEEVNLLYRKSHSLRIKKLFQNCCLRELTTLEGRIEAVKRVFAYGYNVPVYINPSLLFIKIHSANTLWINIVNVLRVIKTPAGADIIFRGDVLLHLDANYRSVLNAYKKALAILEYKNDFIFD